MHLFGLVIRYVSNGCKRIGGAFFRITQLLDALLPALFSPTQLSKLIHVHYEDSYRDASGRYSAEDYGRGLYEWEEDVLARHKIVSGTTIVLGAGVGRESIELARRGLRVIGLDIGRDAHLCPGKLLQHPHPPCPRRLHLPLRHHVQLHPWKAGAASVAPKTAHPSESGRTRHTELLHRANKRASARSACPHIQFLAGQLARSESLVPTGRPCFSRSLSPRLLERRRTSV
jgi:hypothetical protein